MKKIILLLCIASIVMANIESNSQQPIEIEIIEQDMNHVVLNYKINHFNIGSININDELYHKIELSGEPNSLIQYYPDLPHINRSLIVPNDQSMIASVIDSEYTLYSDMNIVPSKGNVPRNIDINELPFVEGVVYNINEFYPSNLVDINDPYILRDFRGQVLQLNPFSYNPVTQELKVYNDVTIRIDFNGNNRINSLSESLGDDKKIINDYNNLYLNHFLNYETYLNRYTPINEDGEMLVICYDSFCDEMQPFVDWKNQKGIKTTLVPKSDAGTTSTSIKNYVQSFYNSHDLVYLLLVGDKSQIPTFEVGGGWSSGESDVTYAYLSGNDSYPEFFVGRFCAQNSSHVNTQVERTIEYERDPQLNASWYSKGLLIASNEGAGNGHDGGESDWQHARNMRSDLMDYTYTNVDEMYDGSHGGEDNSGNPSDSMVRTAINQGLGIIHYTGHGDTDVWVTSNFNTGDVNSLTNTNELPFICTVGCKSGDFGGTCLGEVFTYATSSGEPTGAIATFMSTIYQSWAPPMEAQDEMVDILVENYNNNRKFSFGGISWNGCLKMNDAYGSSGDDETDHWTLFGDPSVVLRTDAPSTLSVTHSGSFDSNDGAYEVIINGNHDNILAALSHEGNLLGSSYAEGNVAVIVVNEDVSDYNELTLTVTGYNTTTIIEAVQLGDACPGYVLGDLNGNSTVNIQDIVILVNIVLSLSDADNCQLQYGDVNTDGVINILDVIMAVNIILN